MSRRARSALHLAVRDAIRTYCSFDSGLCEVCQNPGKPHTRTGKYFAAVCAGSRSWIHNQSVANLIGCKVVLTMQTGEAEQDRVGAFQLNTVTDGLFDKMADIANALMQYRYNVIALANGYLGASFDGSSGKTGFAEPLIPKLEGAEIPCNADWFGGSGAGVFGYRLELSLEGAKLMQALGSEATS